MHVMSIRFRQLKVQACIPDLFRSTKDLFFPAAQNNLPADQAKLAAGDVAILEPC
jgi:hypothetical protein